MTTKKSVLILGASRGLGLALAEEYCAVDYEVVATVRTPSPALERLHERFPSSLQIKSADTIDPDSIVRLKDEFQESEFDTLFVNAGICIAKDNTPIDVVESDFVALMLTNALSPMRVVETFRDRVSPRGVTFVDTDIDDAQKAADSHQKKVLLLRASTNDQIDAAFARLAQERVGSALVAGDLFLNSRMEQIGSLASRYSIPTLYPWREATVLGGLMSYGADIQDAFHLGGVLAGKILHGGKPAELPVEQATKVQLVINLKTAKALGLTFPLSLLGRADEVIE